MNKKKTEVKEDIVKEKKVEEISPSNYPVWRYHKNGSAKIVNSLKEDKELGSDWKDSPAAFEVKEAK